MPAYETKPKGLDFEYCECGCKGYEASAGGEHFWIHWDLNRTFRLHRGHGWAGPIIGSYGSMEAAVEEANKRARAALNKMKEDLGL